jgi:hypothetical protein
MRVNLKSWIRRYTYFQHNDPVKNAWILSSSVYPTIQVYMRKGHHYIDAQLVTTMDIANIVIADSQTGKGIGTELIDYVHSTNPFQVTMIESILNDRFYNHLKKLGWQDVFLSNPPSVYKKV